MNIPPAKPLSLLLTKGTAQDKTRYQDYHPLISKLARLSSITWIAPTEKPQQSASAFVGNLELFIPLEGIIDLKEETSKIKKEILRLQKEIERAESKLQNPSFIDRAPAEIVEQERRRIQEFQTTLRQQEEQLDRLSQVVKE
jgi:valyl-tRNA synthetase